ncbi:hypothetical protein ACRAWC_23490 [Leifsonia sp. L25]|uniref:hypothetical protein n=1 Tax=Leifsonia sp. L25 TaxID=3423957 RepID=UPI003D69C51D
MGGKNSQLAWLFYKFLMFDKAGYTAVYGSNSVYPGGLNTSIPAYQPAANPAKPLFKPIPAMGDQDLWSTAIKAGKQIPGGAPIPSWWSGAGLPRQRHPEDARRHDDAQAGDRSVVDGHPDQPDRPQ